MRLDKYSLKGYTPRRSKAIQVLWHVLHVLLFSSRLIPGSAWRRALLKLFGASVGRGVVIKPGARIKYPWRLIIGDHCWIGESSWIDNVADVTIGNHVCISQGVYICGGSHDYRSPTFDLLTKPITVNDHVWLAAYSVVGPGTIVAEGAVLSLYSVASGNLDPWTIYRGNPAVPVRTRSLAAEEPLGS